MNKILNIIWIHKHLNTIIDLFYGKGEFQSNAYY